VPSVPNPISFTFEKKKEKVKEQVKDPDEGNMISNEISGSIIDASEVPKGENVSSVKGNEVKDGQAKLSEQSEMDSKTSDECTSTVINQQTSEKKNDNKIASSCDYPPISHKAPTPFGNVSAVSSNKEVTSDKCEEKEKRIVTAVKPNSTKNEIGTDGNSSSKANPFANINFASAVPSVPNPISFTFEKKKEKVKEQVKDPDEGNMISNEVRDVYDSNSESYSSASLSNSSSEFSPVINFSGDLSNNSLQVNAKINEDCDIRFSSSHTDECELPSLGISQSLEDSPYNKLEIIDDDNSKGSSTPGKENSFVLRMWGDIENSISESSSSLDTKKSSIGDTGGDSVSSRNEKVGFSFCLETNDKLTQNVNMEGSFTPTRPNKSNNILVSNNISSIVPSDSFIEKRDKE